MFCYKACKVYCMYCSIWWHMPFEVLAVTQTYILGTDQYVFARPAVLQYRFCLDSECIGMFGHEWRWPLVLLCYVGIGYGVFYWLIWLEFLRWILNLNYRTSRAALLTVWFKWGSHLFKLAVEVLQHWSDINESCVQKKMSASSWDAEKQWLPMDMPSYALEALLYVVFKFSIKEIFSRQLYFQIQGCIVYIINAIFVQLC